MSVASRGGARSAVGENSRARRVLKALLRARAHANHARARKSCSMHRIFETGNGAKAKTQKRIKETKLAPSVDGGSKDARALAQPAAQALVADNLPFAGGNADNGLRALVTSRSVLGALCPLRAVDLHQCVFCTCMPSAPAVSPPVGPFRAWQVLHHMGFLHRCASTAGLSGEALAEWPADGSHSIRASP